MARDNSSIPQTCPLINDVIEFIDYSHEIEDKEELIAQSKVFIDVMEDIRKHNEDLRSWGNEMYIEKEYREKEIENLNSKIEDLLNEINELKELLYSV